MTTPDTLTIDGVEYERIDGRIAGPRHIIVVDNGWIFVGNLTENERGDIVITKARNVRSFESVGFGGLTKDPKSANVKLDPVADLIIRKDREVFRVPVPEDWNA